MKILCLSDTHGELPEINLDGIDLVLHAGDFSLAAKNDLYKQLAYYEQVFCPWARRILDRTDFAFIPGNHEVFFEKVDWRLIHNDVTERSLVLDSIKLSGKASIYGFPWTPRFYDWAFNADDTPEDMGRRCKQIPEGIDILLCHGPPYGVLDLVPPLGRKGRLMSHVGSKELASRTIDLKPKLVVFGHLHSNFGVAEVEGTKYVGASLADEDYLFNRQPIVLDLEV